MSGSSLRTWWARVRPPTPDLVLALVLSVLVLQPFLLLTGPLASAARQVLETRPSSLVEVRDAMAAVERVGQQAMDELRHMLGVLGGGSVDPRAPQAGLDRLDALRQRIEDSGVPVRLEVTGTVVALPAGVDLTAYRVIQEALTNVLRHASGTTATASLHYGAKALLVEVNNSPPAQPAVTSGGGRGLAGLAERVRLYHGSLTAGVLPDGGYRVSARLPITVVS